MEWRKKIVSPWDMRNQVALLQNFGNGFFLFILQDDFPLLMAAECRYKTESKRNFLLVLECPSFLPLFGVCVRGNSWYAGCGEIEPSSSLLLFVPPRTGFCSGTVFSSFFCEHLFFFAAAAHNDFSIVAAFCGIYISGCGKYIFI